MPVVIQTRDGEFRAQTPFAEKETCKAIPGRRWNKLEKSWVWPATSTAARNLYSAFRRYEEAGQFIYDEPFRQAIGRAIARQQIIDADKHEIPELTHIKTPPFEHQLRGSAAIITSDSFYLAWEMGTGKTMAVIYAAANGGISPVLVLAPKVVVQEWPIQLERHCPVEYDVRALADSRRTVKKRTEEADEFMKQYAAIPHGKCLFVVINYEAAIREPFKKWSKEQPWSMIVMDEIHRIKSPSGITSRYCKDLCDRTRDRGGKCVGLSGTPMPNDPSDLYAQMRALDPGVFGTSFSAFKQEFCVFGGWNGQEVVAFVNQPEMNRRFYSMAHRVTKDEVLDLPPLHHVDRAFDLGDKEIDMYQRIEEEVWLEIKDAETAIEINNALTRLLKLQQASGGFILGEERVPHRFGQSKTQVMSEIIEDLGEKEPIVVACRFVEDLCQVAETAQKLGRDYYELRSGRDDVQAWRNAEIPGVLGLQVDAGSEGIDLTRARYCICYSVGFSPGKFDQLMARFHRQGQTRSVTCLHLIAEGTVDRKIYKAIDKKQNVIESVLSQMRAERQ